MGQVYDRVISHIPCHHVTLVLLVCLVLGLALGLVLATVAFTVATAWLEGEGQQPLHGSVSEGEPSPNRPCAVHVGAVSCCSPGPTLLSSPFQRLFAVGAGHGDKRSNGGGGHGEGSF